LIVEKPAEKTSGFEFSAGSIKISSRGSIVGYEENEMILVVKSIIRNSINNNC
jgi:hypothetical protein